MVKSGTPSYLADTPREFKHEKARMGLRLSETTGKRMFHRSQAPPVIHEVEFHELSVLTTSYAGEPESA